MGLYSGAYSLENSILILYDRLHIIDTTYHKSAESKKRSLSLIFVSEITNRRDLTVLFSVTESWARGRVEWARPRVQLTV